MLAFEAPFLCALTSFSAALMFIYAWRIGSRPWFIVVGAFGWLSWTIYFGLLAITAGPAPMLDRNDIAPMVRLAELFGGMLIAAWLLLWIRHEVRFPGLHMPDDKASYTRNGEPC